MALRAFCLLRSIGRRLIDCAQGVLHHAADRAANAAHHSQADSQIAHLADGLIGGYPFGHVEAAFILIGISLQRALLGKSLGLNYHALGLSLLVDNADLLPQLRFRHIGILSEMQFFEPLIGAVFLRFDDGGYIKSFQRKAVIRKIGP